MTDLQTIKAMLDRIGNAYEKTAHTDGTISLTVWGGYIGFFTYFNFSSDGALQEIGAGE